MIYTDIRELFVQVDSTRRPSLPNKNSPLPNQSPSSTLPASPPPQASSSTFSSSRMATENVTQAPPMRSTELGGSLGPSFIISVGDPQKVGSSLNVASQHTVYTVRTQVSSSSPLLSAQIYSLERSDLLTMLLLLIFLDYIISI